MDAGKILKAGLVGLLTLVGSAAAFADERPIIAVTDLTYEQAVSQYFNNTNSEHQSSFQAGGGQMSMSSSSQSGEITQITRGELHKFTGDIRGALLKSGAFRLIQGRPWTQRDTTTLTSACIPPKCDGSPQAYSEQITIHDVIDRIQKGYYTGADYVLFGTVSSIQSRNEANPIQATNAINYMLSMELMAEFSLINTKTYEIVAGFSAMGEGSDARLINTPGAVVQLSRGKVMQAVSRSLGDAVLAEIQSQFSAGAPAAPPPPPSGDGQSGKVIEFH